MNKINEDIYLKALGSRILALRESAGMSREQLGEILGVTRMQVYRIEKGIKKNSPTISTLLRIADVFSIDISELIKAS